MPDHQEEDTGQTGPTCQAEDGTGIDGNVCTSSFNAQDFYRTLRHENPNYFNSDQVARQAMPVTPRPHIAGQDHLIGAAQDQNAQRRGAQTYSSGQTYKEATNGSYYTGHQHGAGILNANMQPGAARDHGPYLSAMKPYLSTATANHGHNGSGPIYGHAMRNQPLSACHPNGAGQPGFASHPAYAGSSAYTDASTYTGQPGRTHPSPYGGHLSNAGFSAHANLSAYPGGSATASHSAPAGQSGLASQNAPATQKNHTRGKRGEDRIGRPKPPPWTQQEIDLAQELKASGCTNQQTADIMGRTALSVSSMLWRQVPGNDPKRAEKLRKQQKK